MKGLRKVIPPFAPDQSGAASVLYALGGIIVILDAGGCAGNICGFDEPRWQTRKSAIFSAGLRDMDAILGRDELLIKKLKDTTEKVEGSFVALIGTPVPAVIATDFHVLEKMAEKKTGLPVISVNTDGMELYDAGAEKAYLTLMRKFAQEKMPTVKGRVGVLGMTPLDFGNPDDEKVLRNKLKDRGWSEIWCYGNGSLDEIKNASTVERNLVVAPDGLKAAIYLEEKFGIPYECLDPLAEDIIKDADAVGKRILVVHQQIRANSIRNELLKKGAKEVTTASWFMMKPELKMEGDINLTEEDQLKELLEKGQYDLIVGDKTIWGVSKKNFENQIELSHFAVSGRTDEAWKES